eukprot:GHVL01026155.1.p1 GENE.GHVL01026155.1~~GHVL01026155.1.p1  ORF type:complete len:515 (-),score=82.48 GHVL01026155.1:137-1681(-)
MVLVIVKWNKQELTVDVDVNDDASTFKMQLFSLTNVPVDNQKILGFKGGLLKDGVKMADLGIKEAQKVTLIGTAEGGGLMPPEEKTVFVEDMTSEQKAKALKEIKADPVPNGLVNLGNTCYMNSVIQFLKPVKELREKLATYRNSHPGVDLHQDVHFTKSFGQVYEGLEKSTDAFEPVVFMHALGQRFPQFAERTAGKAGGPMGQVMQQDAEECWNCFLTVLNDQLKTEDGGGFIDKLLQFRVISKIKCLENEKEEIEDKMEYHRKLSVLMGNQLNPVAHMNMGIQLALNSEVFEKFSPSLERDSQYSKVSSIDSLPPYMMVHFVRFEWKKAHELARTEARKTKVTRKVAFPQIFDIWEFASDNLKQQLKKGRDIWADSLEREAAERNKIKKPSAACEDKGTTCGDLEMKEASLDDEELDTGHYELMCIVSHQGRAADSGHYLCWIKKNDDEWIKYDDNVVSIVKQKDTDLAGGRGDYHIAYLVLYKKKTINPTKEVVGAVDEASNNNNNSSSA